jgi:hypothetical protein
MVWAHGPTLMPALARLLCAVSAAPTHDVLALEKLARLRPCSAAAPPNDNSAQNLAQLKLVLLEVLEACLLVGCCCCCCCCCWGDPLQDAPSQAAAFQQAGGAGAGANGGRPVSRRQGV